MGILPELVQSNSNQGSNPLAYCSADAVRIVLSKVSSPFSSFLFLPAQSREREGERGRQQPWKDPNTSDDEANAQEIKADARSWAPKS